jgi:phage terminase large subunit
MLATERFPVSHALLPMLQPKRYKAAYGGRGGMKSRFFGSLAVATNAKRPARGVCIREVQNSIKDSVKMLVEDEIKRRNMSAKFDCQRDQIVGKNGSLMIFKGMHDYNADNIKSLEDFDWAWVEEANKLAARSWRLLRPTIRKPNSEIWCGWNPQNDTDPVDEFFRGAHPPEDSVIIPVGWRDNPWFPDVLRKEMERDYRADPEMAEHVWGGGYEIISEAAYYARQLAQLEKQGRVGDFKYDPRQRLRTAWDLGFDDYMACWFIQDNGNTSTVVDYYEANGVGFAEFVATCMPELFTPPPNDEQWIGWERDKALADFERAEPYKYDMHFLPHDVRVHELGAGGRDRHTDLMRLGLRNVNKGVAANPERRIAAVRSLLPSVQFANTPRVMHGLKRLRHYKRKRNELMGIYVGPLKDGNDHAADAFGEYAINSDLLPRHEPVKPKHAAQIVNETTLSDQINYDLPSPEEVTEDA